MHLAMRPLEKIWVFMVDLDEHALIASYGTGTPNPLTLITVFYQMGVY